MFFNTEISSNKPKGSIEVICGSMFSGKTEELLRRLKRVELANIEYIVFKPDVDKRYDNKKIVSHNKNTITAIPLKKSTEILKLVKKAKVFPVECVVRGYLAGSGWKEYQNSQSVCGISLPTGLLESSRLTEPLLTPSTKATTGHDENISFKEMTDLIGTETAMKLREISLAIYKKARDYAGSKGIIIADTKFEFGTYEDEIILIDEVLTPDSSRFWPSSEYEPGKSQNPFDKQFIRDYLEEIRWNKQPPAPSLPDWVIEATSKKYLEAFELLTERRLEN